MVVGKPNLSENKDPEQSCNGTSSNVTLHANTVSIEFDQGFV